VEKVCLEEFECFGLLILCFSGELCLKLAKEYPDATVVSYSSTDEDAQAHATSANNLGVTNNVVGNPLHYAQSTSHDPIERALLDLRSSLDLFDVQIVTSHLFALLMHHSQSEFERTLGSSFAMARSTVIWTPLCSTLSGAVEMFGGHKLDLSCYSKKKRVTLDPSLSLAESEAAHCAVGMLLCAAEAANVEVSVRLLRKLNLTNGDREVVAEVSLLSMDRPVGGMFQYGEEEGKSGGDVAVGNYALQFRKEQSSGEEKLWITRKDGVKWLMWKSPPRGRGVQQFVGAERGRGVSLYSLLSVYPIPMWRRDLVQRYLHDADTILSPARNVAGRAEPWCTYLYRGSLFYVWPFARDELGTPIASYVSDPKQLEASAEDRSPEREQIEIETAAGIGLAADIAALQKRWFDSPLSYIEHASQSGFTSAAIARIFPRSSVVVVCNTTKAQKEIERLMRRNSVVNAVVLTQSGGMSEYGSNLAASPEFFNFQYFNGFFSSWRRDEVDLEGSFPEGPFSALLGAAQVSYVLLPHPQVMSLALAVFHGPNPALRVYSAASQSSKSRHVDHYAGKEDRVDASILELYKVEAHPSKTPLANWDYDLIESRLKLSEGLELSMARVAVPRARVGANMKDLKHNPSRQWNLVNDC
jgi:hypothetical protein